MLVFSNDAKNYANIIYESPVEYWILSVWSGYWVDHVLGKVRGVA